MVFTILLRDGKVVLYYHSTLVQMSANRVPVYPSVASILNQIRIVPVHG